MFVQSLAVLTTLAATTGAIAGDAAFVYQWDEPTLDRWNYPFNATPGVRGSASSFGNTAGEPEFDNRDGQVYVVFETVDQIPPGAIADLDLVSVTMTITIANEATQYDPTYDVFTEFLPEGDPDRTEPVDPGEPVELYGAGYRNGFNVFAFPEDGPYAFADPLLPSVRNVFAQGFDAKGPLDVSNNVRDRFDPTPFAIGTVADATPGDFLPEGTVMSFELDLSNPAVEGYVRGALAQGRLPLSITSLTRVVPMGGEFPLFYCKESPLVTTGFRSAATLEVIAEPASSCGAPGDLDCDGAVSGSDLAILLGAWGTDDALADLDENGTVSGSDLAILLGDWG